VVARLTVIIGVRQGLWDCTGKMMRLHHPASVIIAKSLCLGMGKGADCHDSYCILFHVHVATKMAALKSGRGSSLKRELSNFRQRMNADVPLL
jgi:hypothetical protein